MDPLLRTRTARECSLVALLACTLWLAGCANRPEPTLASRALLDWGDATIGLPLDAYGMSPQQENTVRAAQQIVFARCVLGTVDVPAITLEAATETLDMPPAPNRWVYGFWNAGYITAHGIGTPWAVYSIGNGLEVSQEQGKACVYSDDYMNLNTINGSAITSSLSGNDKDTGLIMAIGMTANGQTLADSRFKDLAMARSSCAARQGYAIDPDSSYRGVAFQDGWSTEQRLRAALAEAQCGDEINFMQQAGDITATYQQALIDQHEAELVAIQQLVQDRVARATAILHEVGLV